MFEMFARKTLTVVLAAALGAAQAGTVRYYAEGDVPDPAVVARILGRSAAAPRMKMRGGPALDEPAAQRSSTLAADGGRNVNDDPLERELALNASARSAVQAWQSRPGVRAAAAAAPTAPQPTALAVAIRFDNDSARLHGSALPSLAAVAEGMRLAGGAGGFVIEGHTSASGAWSHNLRLSRERAESVKRYLVQHHGIAANALRTEGLGPRAPLNSADPGAAENRRVQFRSA